MPGALHSCVAAQQGTGDHAHMKFAEYSDFWILPFIHIWQLIYTIKFAKPWHFVFLLGTSSPSTFRRRLNQSEPLLPSLGGRSHTILVVEGSCGFSNRKFQLIGFWQGRETNSLANQT